MSYLSIEYLAEKPVLIKTLKGQSAKESFDAHQVRQLFSARKNFLTCSFREKSEVIV